MGSDESRSAKGYQLNQFLTQSDLLAQGFENVRRAHELIQESRNLASEAARLREEAKVIREQLRANRTPADSLRAEARILLEESARHHRDSRRILGTSARVLKRLQPWKFPPASDFLPPPRSAKR